MAPARWARWLVIVSVATACGGDAKPPAAVRPSAPSNAPSPSPAGLASPASPPTDSTAATDDPSTAAGRAEHRFDIVGGPDWLAVADSSMWVKLDSGHLARIDPEANEIVATVKVSDTLCQGIGGHGDVVWSCDGSAIVRVDPATNEVVATVEVDKTYPQGEFGVGFGHVWVLANYGKTLTGVSNATNKVAVEIPLGTSCSESDVGLGAVWLACPADGLVLRVDPRSREVTDRIPKLPGAEHVSVADAVWVGFDGGTARIDATSRRVSATSRAAPGDAGNIFATPSAVWVRAEGRFLRRLDPRSGEVLEEISADERSGGEVVVAFGSVWASAYDDMVVYRLRRLP